MKSPVGVDYNKIDPLKKHAQDLAKTTSQNSDLKVVEESRGESAFVWEEADSYKALVIEGLGTKNLIADKLREKTGKTYYDTLAQDTVAMIVNDLIVVGAKPQVINAYFAAGSEDWFIDEQRSKDLVEGFAKACKEAGAVWGGGESPALSGIINPQTADLAGSAIGVISPKERLTLGDKITAGDAILLIESSGIHSNGLSATRELATSLEEGYETKLPDGSSFGEALLIPTHIYSHLVQDLFEEGIDIHYMVNITGHGFRKLMRATQEFSYIINELPPLQPIFEFIQEKSGLSPEQMYGTFNMGAGFAIYLPKSQVQKAQEIADKHNLKSYNSGEILTGEKQVVINPKNISFKAETLNVR
jgi:phosphoribosylformylglycinamidine cyclo-ligase